MGNCFVIKLNEVVTNNSLPQLGVLSFKLDKLLSKSFFVCHLAAGDTTFRLRYGNGWLSTSENVTNGKDILTISNTTTSEVNIYIHLTDDDYLIIQEPENVTRLGGAIGVFSGAVSAVNIGCEIEGLKYATALNHFRHQSSAPLLKFDLAELKNASKLNHLIVLFNPVKPMDCVYGSINDIYPNLLRTLQIYSSNQKIVNNKITCDISKVESPLLNTISLRGCSVTGDISKLICSESLLDFRIGVEDSAVTSLSCSSSIALWKEVKLSNGIVRILQPMSTASIDNFLIILSQVDWSQTVESNRVIELYGTRSYVSDSAISGLERQGVEIKLLS